jgi:hypothetical protein
MTKRCCNSAEDTGTSESYQSEVFQMCMQKIETLS